MTFPACYQHIPNVRLGILVLSGQFPSEVSANKQRLLGYLLQLQRTPLLTCQQIKERKVRETSRRGDFFIYRWPLPRVWGCSSPEILLFTECYRWLRGQEALPFPNSALGTTGGLEGALFFLPSVFSKPPTEKQKRKKKEREKEWKNWSFKIFKKHIPRTISGSMIFSLEKI